MRLVGRAGSVRTGSRVGLVLTLLTGCFVDDEFLVESFFACEGPSDCGDGWGCVRGTPYAVDFCASDCSAESCDGICTVQGDRSLCLRGCRINDDGSTSSCSDTRFACIRTSADRNDGVCYPVTPCATRSDCENDEVCLGEVVDAPVGERTSYCIPRPDPAMVCPPKSFELPLEDDGSVCVATCAPPDTRCPPGFGCLQQLQVVASPGESPCWPGVYGLPCDDDSNCYYGRCLDTGDAGKQCSVSCNEAARLAGGCDALPNLSMVWPTFSFECDPEAGGGVDGGLCVTRSSIGFICTTPESDAYRCAEGLECRTFVNRETGDQVKLCSRDCFGDLDCGMLNYCLPSPLEPGSCLPRAPAGARCFEARQCRSGNCTGGRCIGNGT